MSRLRLSAIEAVTLAVSILATAAYGWLLSRH